MEQSKPDSYYKAMDSWNNAKIRFNNAWPYLKQGGESLLQLATWLGLIYVTLPKQKESANKLSAKSPLDPLSPLDPNFIQKLPQETQLVIGLFEQINGRVNNRAVTLVPTAGLFLCAEGPAKGQKIIGKTSYVVKNCLVGARDLIKCGYHYINYCTSPKLEIAANIEGDELSPVGEEGEGAIPQE